MPLFGSASLPLVLGFTPSGAAERTRWRAFRTSGASGKRMLSIRVNPNIPIRTDEGRKIITDFVEPRGEKLVSA